MVWCQSLLNVHKSYHEVQKGIPFVQWSNAYLFIMARNYSHKKILLKVILTLKDWISLHGPSIFDDT